MHVCQLPTKTGFSLVYFMQNVIEAYKCVGCVYESALSCFRNGRGKLKWPPCHSCTGKLWCIVGELFYLHYVLPCLDIDFLCQLSHVCCLCSFVS